MWYKVADANEMMVVTGFGIKEFVLAKKRMVYWPLQKCTTFTITPFNYESDIRAMSHEKLRFKIPAALTIGPDLDDAKNLQRYVRLLVTSGNRKSQEKVIRERVAGIVEGEMRAVAASMPIEEIYNNRKEFRGRVVDYIQTSLSKFGLELYNANIKELIDESGYFAAVGMKASEGAASQAKVSIAESKANGDVGACIRESRATQETCRLVTDQTIFENERAQQVAQSKAELDIKSIRYNAKVKVADIEGKKAAAMRDVKLQADLERQRALVEVEKRRTVDAAKAVVEAQRIRQMADAEAYKRKQQSEAKMYEDMKLAEGQLYDKEKEAQGIEEIFKAQSEGLSELLASFSSDEKSALDFLMMERQTFQQLAAHNANAIQGLSPEFSFWETDQDADAVGLIGLAKSLPPILSTIKDQTGIQPPSWLANMPNGKEQE